MTPPSPEQLDEILSVQLLLAWAGETPGGDVPRLGWWKTDVIDEDGGGDLWKRLLPRTQRWAGLDAARRAAILTDAKLRHASTRADQQLTLFHFGLALDELLAERLAHHVLEAKPPLEVLPLLKALERFDRAQLVTTLAAGDLDASFKVSPEGRQLKKAASESLPARARRLALALLAEPVTKTYPVAFILDEASSAKR